MYGRRRGGGSGNKEAPGLLTGNLFVLEFGGVRQVKQSGFPRVSVFLSCVSGSRQNSCQRLGVELGTELQRRKRRTWALGRRRRRRGRGEQRRRKTLVHQHPRHFYDRIFRAFNAALRHELHRPGFFRANSRFFCFLFF